MSKKADQSTIFIPDTGFFSSRSDEPFKADSSQSIRSLARGAIWITETTLGVPYSPDSTGSSASDAVCIEESIRIKQAVKTHVPEVVGTNDPSFTFRGNPEPPKIEYDDPEFSTRSRVWYDGVLWKIHHIQYCEIKETFEYDIVSKDSARRVKTMTEDEIRQYIK